MSCPLLWGSSVQRLDPPHCRYDVVFQVVGFAYFVSVLYVVWIDGDWDIEGDDTVSSCFEYDIWSYFVAKFVAVVLIRHPGGRVVRVQFY